MIKVPLALAYIKRTIRPLYANTQATPKSVFLDPAYVASTPDIYPGMAMKKTTGQNVLPVAASGDKVYGLANFYEAAAYGITEITNQGINATSVWVLGPDAEFQVLAPAFDTTQTWTDGALVTAIATGANQGKLAPVGGTGTLVTQAFARVLSVDSPTQITIGGLSGTV
jgi:hypothetical protein